MHQTTESGVLGGGSEPATAGRPVKRDALFDAMKGFGILLVIIGHAVQGSSDHFDDIFAFRMIYSFHMPLFFFISGYILQLGLERKRLAPISFVLKKAHALVVPFLSWYLIFGLWRGIPSNLTVAEYAGRLILSPDYGFWFLWVLFVCFVLMLPVAWLQQRVDRRWRAGLIALSWLTLYLLRRTNTGVWGLGLIKIHYFYFAAGFFICSWREQLSVFKKWLPDLCIVGFLLLVPYWKRTGEMPFQPFLTEHFPERAALLSDCFEFLLALLGIGSVAQIVKGLLSGPVGRWLVWIGNYTLDIYVLHQYTFLFIPLGVILIPYKSDTLLIAMEVVWGVGASLAISFLLLRRSLILKFLFLGILDGRKANPNTAFDGIASQDMAPPWSGSPRT